MKRLLGVPVLLALCSAAIVAPATAADLTVRFEGRFEAGTCPISIADVDLGRHPATFFDNAAATTPVDFQIHRGVCTPDIRQMTLRLDGVADSRRPNYFAVPAAGGVTGLAVQIIDPINMTMVPNTRVLTTSLDPNMPESIDFSARLVRLDPLVTAGLFSIPLTLNVAYN